MLKRLLKDKQSNKYITDQIKTYLSTDKAQQLTQQKQEQHPYSKCDYQQV